MSEVMTDHEFDTVLELIAKMVENVKSVEEIAKVAEAIRNMKK